MKKYFTLKVQVFLSSFLLLMLSGRSKLFSDPGTFSHTAIGEHILRSGNFIYNDIFSFTFYGKAWIAQQWLGECIMALLNRLGGLDALLFMGVLLLSSLYAWLASRLFRSGLHSLTLVLIIVFVFASSSPHLHLRPHILSIVFLGITYSILCDYERGLLTFPRLIWIAPIFIVWTNIHGGVLAGLGTVWIMVMGWTLARTFGLKSPVKTLPELGLLWMLLLIISLTLFLNPYGSEVPKTWFSIMQSPVIQDVILEHLSVFELFRRTKPTSVLALMGIFSLAFFYFISLAGIFPKKLRISWFVPAIWFILALGRVRHAPLFAIVSAIALGEILPNARWVNWAERKGLISFKKRSMLPNWRYESFVPFFIAVLLFSSIVIAYSTLSKAPIPGQVWAKLDARRWPVELLPELRAYEQSLPNGTPIFNDFAYGGFLMYFTPKLRVFIDDRCELYGDQFLLDYVNADFVRFYNWLKQYDVEIALVGSSSKYAAFLKEIPEWKEVNRTATAMLFQKSYSNPN
jgi:hypothetical protein